jgi:hypothetical protein
VDGVPPGSSDLSPMSEEAVLSPMAIHKDSPILACVSILLCPPAFS